MLCIINNAKYDTKYLSLTVNYIDWWDVIATLPREKYKKIKINANIWVNYYLLKFTKKN